jgi:regulator of replication initiation timing
LQDDVEEQLRNLHMDMIAQFHQQSQEISKHLETINLLLIENQQLRDENDQLRRN